MILLPAVLGSSLVLLVVVSAWSLRRYPNRRHCPICSNPTAPLEGSRVARKLAPWMQLRWCADCDWEGVGRKGPAFDPIRGPSAHDSGFRWNGDDAETGIPGFQWADTEAPPAEDTDHPSGFRWADSARPPQPDRSMADSSIHPSGFQWRENAAPEDAADETPEPVADPSGFRWASQQGSRPRQPGGFMWKDERNGRS